jgi:hypothetical protein
MNGCNYMKRKRYSNKKIENTGKQGALKKYPYNFKNTYYHKSIQGQGIWSKSNDYINSFSLYKPFISLERHALYLHTAY